MNIRPASFGDLARIDELFRASTHEGDTPGLGGESPRARQPLVRVWHAFSKTLSSLVPLTDPSDALLVAEDGEHGVVGFIQAQLVPGQKKAWQVVNLCVVPKGRGSFAAAGLVGHLCNQAMEQGITRLYVRVPLDHPMQSNFLEQGFTQYATEQILYRDDGNGAQPESLKLPADFRAGRRDDLGQLYLLYLRTTPSTVANLEGPSLKTWQSTFAGGWMAKLGKDDVIHYVMETAGIVAWAGIKPASSTRPAAIALMCEGHDAHLRDRFVDGALELIPAGPISCILRHYDSELIRALQQRGFEIFGSQLLLVRDLGTKIRVRATATQKKPILAPSGFTNFFTPNPRAPGTADYRSITSSGRSNLMKRRWPYLQR